MSSIEPDCSGSEIDCCEKVDGGFVVARGDGAELLERAEEILDEMALFVERLVVSARLESRELLGGMTTVFPTAVNGPITR